MFNYLITLSGKRLSPSNLSLGSKINITSFHNSGDINRAGNISDTGYMCIEGNSIEELYWIALDLKAISFDIDEIEFSVIRYYDEQCNIEFSPKELKIISELGAQLSISCVKNE